MRTKYSTKPQETLKEFKEIEHDLLGQSSSLINNIPTSDRKNLKKSVSDVLLLAKNCFNQGEVAFFNAKEEAGRSVTEILKRKIMPKK